jgi:hypothetical protein
MHGGEETEQQSMDDRAHTRLLTRICRALGAGLILASVGLALGSTALEAQAQSARPVQLAFGLTSGNALVRFDTAAPGTILGRSTVTGLQAGESLTGIDFRPANNALYGVGSTGRLYTINPASGAAQVVGSGPLPTPLRGSAFGVDVNPVPDRLRVVSTDGQNLRINMATLEVNDDGALAYAPGDRNAGVRPNVVAAGYTNNVAGSQATMLFVIDAARDVLALQNPPNDGVLNTVGPLGVDTSDVAGLDVAPGTGTAFAALLSPGAPASALYTIDLGTGAARRVGPIGGGQPVRGLALVLDGTATFAGPGAVGLPRTGGAGIAGAGLVAAALGLCGGAALRALGRGRR